MTSDTWFDIGNNATMTCTISRTATLLQWRKSSTDVTSVHDAQLIVEYGLDDGHVYYGNDIEGNHYAFRESSGMFILTVKSVVFSDAGKYWCFAFVIPIIYNDVEIIDIQIRGECTTIGLYT